LDIIKDKLDKNEISKKSFETFKSKLEENCLDFLKQWINLNEEQKDKMTIQED
jgi:hypothetical protein